MRERLRNLGIQLGELPAGPHNAITDVAGVRVGHTTLIRCEGVLQPGVGPVRTGVTVILPHGDNIFRQKVRAAVHTINGFGKATGFEQVRELGTLETPIALTNTLNVGLVADALVQHAIRENPDIGIGTSTVNAVVGETNDGYLNDIQGRHVGAAHVFAAIAAARTGAVELGAVGAGTGTSCYGWKGGIGTASRTGRSGYRVGVLVQSNFGVQRDLLVAGVPIGRLLATKRMPSEREMGSVMIVVATDAPCDSRQLGRLCVRVGAGLARTGSLYGNQSGDFVIAFSTRNLVSHAVAAPLESAAMLLREDAMDELFRAVVEATEEAVLDSLFTAETMTGRDDHTRLALPADEVLALLKKHGASLNAPGGEA